MSRKTVYALINAYKIQPRQTTTIDWSQADKEETNLLARASATEEAHTGLTELELDMVLDPYSYTEDR